MNIYSDEASEKLLIEQKEMAAKNEADLLRRVEEAESLSQVLKDLELETTVASNALKQDLIKQAETEAMLDNFNLFDQYSKVTVVGDFNTNE